MEPLEPKIVCTWQSQAWNRVWVPFKVLHNCPSPCCHGGNIRPGPALVPVCLMCSRCSLSVISHHLEMQAGKKVHGTFHG